MKGKNNPDYLPSYKNPPIIEVVCGITFERLSEFKAPHLGLFWDKILLEFPKCEHAVPLGPIPAALALSHFPLPRIWFIHKNEDRVIQIQDDRFLYNWRRIRPDDVYPRFEKVMDGFKDNLQKFAKFVDEAGLGVVNPVECELTYINHIPGSQGWESVKDVGLVLPDLNWRSDEARFLPDPVNMGWKALFDFEDKGRLSVDLKQGTRKIDKQEILVLELKATGIGPDKSIDTVWEWYEMARKWIVCGFADLTGKKIQTEVWQREDSDAA